jgi:hypothetical protein
MQITLRKSESLFVFDKIINKRYHAWGMSGFSCVVLFYVRRGLATDWSLIQGSSPKESMRQIQFSYRKGQRRAYETMKK